MEQYHDDSILDPPEPVGLRQKKTGRVRWIVPVLLLLTLAAAAVLLWPKESAPTAEDQDPAPAWETNYLMAGERIPLEGSTMEEQMENAAKHPVLGSKLTRDQIRSVTFLDTLEEIPSSAWDVSAVGNGSVMAWTKLNDGLYDLYIAAEGGINGGNACAYLFAGYKNMEFIDFGASFHTDGSTDMAGMFMGCRSLKELDLSGFDTARVTDFGYMFYACTALEDLTIHTFETSAATSMYAMFSNCNSLKTLDLQQFRTENVTNMGYMFNGCLVLEDLKWTEDFFDTNAVTNMQNMFADCQALTVLELQSFDTGRVTSMHGMFKDCTALEKLDVSGFHTAAVTDMESMFRGCGSLTELKLGQLDTGNVTNMYAMFWDTPCVSIEDVSFFNTEKVEKYDFFMNGTGWESLFG